MLRPTREDGLPIDPAAIRRYEELCDADAPISTNKDLKPDAWRRIEPGDAVHESVRPRGSRSGTEHNDPPPGVEIVCG
jgi:hypothetical protein